MHFRRSAPAQPDPRGPVRERDYFGTAVGWLTCQIIAYRFTLENERRARMSNPPPKPRNLFRLAGVINAANSEADNEAGALIDRVRLNKMRTLGLIAKGHQNETLREQMLAEAEKEQAMADLAAAVGDNGGPLLEEEPDEAEEAIRATLREAKEAHSERTSQSSDRTPKTPPEATTDQQEVAGEVSTTFPAL